MSETTLVKQVLLAINAIPGVRAWRQNTGFGYSPEDIDRVIRGQSVRPVRYGVPGAADITGVAGPAGTRLEVEVKIGSKYGQTDQQKRYQEMIEQHGGIYVLGRSVKQIIDELRRRINECCRVHNGGSGSDVLCGPPAAFAAS